MNTPWIDFGANFFKMQLSCAWITTHSNQYLNKGLQISMLFIKVAVVKQNALFH